MDKTECKYKLPCGWCDRLNDKCIFEQACEAIKSTENQDNDTQIEQAICIHEWEPVNSINTAGYVYRCKKCGTMKTEPIILGLQEHVTTSGNEEFNKKYNLWDSDCSNPCEHCSNNPKNGGTGICHCILGLPEVTCDISENNKIKCEHDFIWDTKELHYRCAKCGEIIYRGYKD